MSKTRDHRLRDHRDDRRSGLDYHNFKCRAAASRIAAEDNAWEQIAEMARPNCPEAEWVRAWELSGLPIPEEYLEAA